jgi:hypothetical protein
MAFRAITETYIPLIWAFERLIEDNVDFRLTMSLTPTLISMLTDQVLQDRYIKHISKLIELSHKEIERTTWQPQFQKLAIMYLNHFCKSRETFEKYHRNLVTAFKNFQDLGKLEIITCGATHGFFPLMDVCKESVRAQLRTAVAPIMRNTGPKAALTGCRNAVICPATMISARGGPEILLYGRARGSARGAQAEIRLFAPVTARTAVVAAFARDLSRRNKYGLP